MLTVHRTGRAGLSLVFSLSLIFALSLAAHGQQWPLPTPGDQASLVSHHPSYDLMTIHPPDELPMVGGLDFLSDGRLVVTYMDPRGSVKIYDGVQGDDPSAITVTEIAWGLFKSLGLKVVNDEIYVLQEHELTKLIDHDGDGIINEYRTVVTGWDQSGNFHEFAFGLIYDEEEEVFYANLGSSIYPGGLSIIPSPAGLDRGTTIRMNPADGTYEVVARGFRTPNGIGWGPEGEIFITDNEGVWNPASKLIHVREGHFYGFRDADPAFFEGWEVTPPIIYFPHHEAANTPTQPVLVIDDSPYKGQIYVGDVHHGGIKRVYLDKVEGEYQGALFRFSQGLEAGINRMVWGPDNALYVGGIGQAGNFSWQGRTHGLQRLKFNGKITFEMLAVRAKTNGMEIEFTEPLGPDKGNLPTDYFVAQWRYVPTPAYGGPKVDYEVLTVNAVHVSPDRRKVFLEIDGRKEGHVIYIRLLADRVTNEAGERPWSTETWYTLNKIPKNDYGFTEPIAVIHSDPYPPSGHAPLTVKFNASESIDPTTGGDIVDYHWDLGDGTSSDAAALTHTYDAEGTYTVTLTVTNAAGLVKTATTEVVVGNTYPAPTIIAPALGVTIENKQNIRFEGYATDAEDGDLAPEQLTWTLYVETATGERAAIATHVGTAGEFVLPDDHHWTQDLTYWVELQATDNDGLSWSTERKVRFTRLHAAYADEISGFQVLSGTGGADEPAVLASGRAGDYIGWHGLNLTGRNPLFVQVAAGAVGGSLEIRLDDPAGGLLGTIPLDEADTWKTVPVPISFDGVHDIYLVASGEGPVVAQVHWIQLVGPGIQ